VEPSEAEIVRLIFQKYVFEGFGAQRLCRYLAETGVRNPKGRNIPTTTINRIIKNPIYTGVICNGNCKSNVIPSLRIIEDDTFQRAQEIMQKRTRHHNDVPLNTRGQSLLVGNVFCGHCGGRLTLTTNGRKRTLKDGTVHRETRARYQCHYNIRHPGECDGQSGYGVTKLDNLVNQIIRLQFERIQEAPPQDLIEQQNKKEIALTRAKLKTLNEQLQSKQREYESLRQETVRVVQGESKLSIELLNDLLEERKNTVAELEMQIQSVSQELEIQMTSMESVLQEYTQLMSWAEMYEHCSFEAKKMIVSQFVKAIHVRRDYELDIEFQVSFEEFQRLYLDRETKETQNAKYLALQTQT